ncbi:hypothetical protein SAMN00120144_3715 [Hymenobacter roseosalivarius DSM 11622]|uniref:Uncharacterized protein n=1 Tax=Hymenobacter roseosalivarius DSM 11622 TaxID=645990 RepID=A0A1W1W2E3_9BACT|nr:hypothetical protein SAMN00120144_3715 [Hymenobacter roseosalivarius DSM 11622]
MRTGTATRIHSPQPLVLEQTSKHGFHGALAQELHALPLLALLTM